MGERAKRKAEIPLLNESIKKDLEDDVLLWKQSEQNRVANAIAERKHYVDTHNRLARMRKDKDDFMITLLSQRKAQFDEMVLEYEEMVNRERKIRLENRKKDRILERKEKYAKAMEERVKQEEEEKLKRIKEQEEREEADRKAKKEEEM